MAAPEKDRQVAQPILQPRGPLTGDERKALLEAVDRKYRGVQHHGEPIILDGLLEEVEEISITPREMDFLVPKGEA